MNRKKRVCILGCPVHKGQHLPGVDLGPDVLRKGGLVEKLKKSGLEVEDQGDVTLPSFEDDVHPGLSLKCPKHVAAGSEKIAEDVRRIIDNGDICLALGGDRSITIGTIVGHAKARTDPIIIWIDAHADIKMPSEVVTGNLHSMPLSFVLKEVQPRLPDIPGFDNIKPCISAKDLVYLGLRKVRPGEQKTIDELDILTYSVSDIDKAGIEKVLEEIFQKMDPKGERSIHLSFDVDSLDPSIAPCVGWPVPDGLLMKDAIYIAEKIARTGRLSLMEITEMNPTMGNEKQVDTTVTNIIEILQSALGGSGKVVSPV